MPDDALTPLQSISWPVSVDDLSISGEELDSLPPATGEGSGSDRQNKILQLARERFEVCKNYETNRRAEMTTDLEFYCGEQWDSQVRSSREGPNSKRPCLTINRMQTFVKHVVNNMRESRPAIKISPLTGGADEENAEIRQGLIRQIEVHSQAEVAYDNAFQQMCIMGLGWMRLIDDWSDPLSFDMDLKVSWISNTFSVYSDPTAAKPDWSDMQYAFIVKDLPLQEFKAQFPDAQACSLNNFMSIGDQKVNWMDGNTIRVAEYYWIEYKEGTLLKWSDGSITFFSQDFTPGPGVNIIEKSTRNIPMVKWAMITALDVLKEREWPGNRIPLVPVLGDQIEKNGEKLLSGMVRYLREPQRLYNYMYSSFVETVALAPRNQFIAETDQIAKYMALYQEANIKPIAVLPYDRVIDGGIMVPPPQRQSAAVDLSAFVQGLTVADQQLKAVSGIYEASLGQRGPQESGKAINARKIESEVATFDWGDNFVRSLENLGRLMNENLQFYYNSPNRQMQVLYEDLTQEMVTFNAPFKNKKGQDVVYDLSKGQYGVVVSTGPSFQTRREQAVAGMMELFKFYPAGLQACAHLLVDQMDFPKHNAIAAQLEKILPPELRDPKDGETQIPPEAQQMLAQMKQTIDNLTQALNLANNEAEKEKTKQEWETFRQGMSDEVNLVIADMKMGHEQAKFLSDKVFNELQQQREILQSMAGQQEQPQQATQ